MGIALSAAMKLKTWLAAIEPLLLKCAVLLWAIGLASVAFGEPLNCSGFFSRSTRSFTRVALALRDEGELAAANRALSALALPPRARSILTPALLSPSEDALTEIASQLATGRRWDQVLPQERHFPGWSIDAIARVFADPLYQAREALRPRHDAIGEVGSKRRQVRLFAAEFRSFPIGFFNSGEAQNGIPGHARLFAMYVPEAEIRDYTGADSSAVPFPHLQSAFAYLRYYVQGSDIVVVEAQSDLYGRMRKAGAGSQYENWAKVLLLAFQSHLRAAGCGRWPGARLVLAGPEYEKQRWQDNPRELAADLARLIYRDVPRSLGYAPVDGLGYAFEWAERVGSREPIAIGAGHAIALEDGPALASLEAQFARELELSTGNAFSDELARLLAACAIRWRASARSGRIASSPEPNGGPGAANGPFGDARDAGLPDCVLHKIS
jgi:hypothetical protein